MNVMIDLIFPVIAPPPSETPGHPLAPKLEVLQPLLDSPHTMPVIRRNCVWIEKKKRTLSRRANEFGRCIEKHRRS